MGPRSRQRWGSGRGRRVVYEWLICCPAPNRLSKNWDDINNVDPGIKRRSPGCCPPIAVSQAGGVPPAFSSAILVSVRAWMSPDVVVTCVVAYACGSKWQCLPCEQHMVVTRNSEWSRWGIGVRMAKVRQVVGRGY